MWKYFAHSGFISSFHSPPTWRGAGPSIRVRSSRAKPPHSNKPQPQQFHAQYTRDKHRYKLTRMYHLQLSTLLYGLNVLKLKGVTKSSFVITFKLPAHCRAISGWVTSGPKVKSIEQIHTVERIYEHHPPSSLLIKHKLKCLPWNLFSENFQNTICSFFCGASPLILSFVLFLCN